MRELQSALELAEKRKSMALSFSTSLGSDVIALEQKLETANKMKIFAFAQLKKTEVTHHVNSKNFFLVNYSTLTNEILQIITVDSTLDTCKILFQNVG